MTSVIILILFFAETDSIAIYSEKFFAEITSGLNLVSEAGVENTTTNEIITLQLMPTVLIAIELDAEWKDTVRENKKGSE